MEMKEEITLFLAIERFVEEKMYPIAGVKVIDDKDLAELFEVEINEFRDKVKENIERFPSDFMIKLNVKGEEKFAFTEPGILMLGGLLKNDKAIKVHMQFIEYFVHLASKFNISVFDLLIHNQNKK